MSDSQSFFTLIDFFQIALFLFACYCCYLAGKFNGAINMVNHMLDNDIITEQDLDKLDEKLNSKD